MTLRGEMQALAERHGIRALLFCYAIRAPDDPDMEYKIESMYLSKWPKHPEEDRLINGIQDIFIEHVVDVANMPEDEADYD